MLFTEDVLKNGSFYYNEFSSAEEIEKWDDEKSQFDTALILITIPEKDGITMEELSKIMTPLHNHSTSKDTRLYYGYVIRKDEYSFPCRIVYHVQD